MISENGECHNKVEEILASHKISWNKVKSIVSSPPLNTVNEALKAEASRLSVPTFSQLLDNKLGGGVSTESILHICGPPGSGKTQLALQLCVNVQIPTCLSGLSGEAIYIDTDSGFSIQRITEISDAVVEHCERVAEVHDLKESVENFNTERILNGVHYMQVGTSVELLSAVQNIRSLILSHPKIKLVVVDTIIFPFLNMTNTLERTRTLSLVINQLYSLALSHDLAVVVTNHVTTKMSGNCRSLVPSLGESFSHIVPQTLCLAKIGNQFTAVVHKSNQLPESFITFKVTQEGIRDDSN